MCVSPGEQYKKLLPVLRLLKQDRERQAQLAQGLQERLRKAQEEASSMKADQAQRDQLLQQIQDQLQQRQSEVAQLEWEVREQLEREVRQQVRCGSLQLAQSTQHPQQYQPHRLSTSMLAFVMILRCQPLAHHCL